MIFLLLLGLLGIHQVISDTCSWNNCPKWSNDPNIWNIHFIPHTHDDLGWQKTVDGYYTTEVRYIFNTMTRELAKNPDRRFTYCETGFMKRWLEENPDGVNALKPLIQNGQLEILGGGWVQPDEGASHYVDLIDQYTLGLRILNDTFGECTHSKVAWQIDPFGHSREHANLMRLMGYESLWFAREHYLEHQWRKDNRALQMMWHTTDDNSTDNTILTGAIYAHYSAPSGFSFDIQNRDEPIQDDRKLENFNVDAEVENFKNYIINMNKTQQSNHFFILMGDDFNYQDAYMYFINIDKLIKYINEKYPNQFYAFYSTPSCYTQAVKNLSITWPQKYTDFFPYATGGDQYVNAYFTNRPSVKGLIRRSSELLQTIRLLQSLALTSWSETIQNQIEILERACGLSQHHDALPATSKDFVMADYVLRLEKAWNEVEPLFQNSMQIISRKVKGNTAPFPRQVVCKRLNESECSFTKQNNLYTVTVHNANGQILNSLVRLPLYQYTNNITLLDSDSKPVGYQVQKVLFNPSQLNNTNISPYEIYFMASVKPLGFRTYFVTVNPSPGVQKSVKKTRKLKTSMMGTRSISNGLIQLDFDSLGRLSTFHDLSSGQSHPLNQEFKYYHGAQPSNGQYSSSYVFKPDPQTPYTLPGPIILDIQDGSLVKEVRQIVAPWISQTIRLTPNKSFVEFEYTIGHIPSWDQQSKEVITTYTVPGLNNSSVFYTDANGRQLMKRIRNWAESYSYQNTEPVAGNYYPIDSRIIISDPNKDISLAILTDRSHGGSSINDGQVEAMIHRRLFINDPIPLNELGRDGRGLVVRGKHWLVLGKTSDVTQAHRTLAYDMFHAPFLTFGSNSYGGSYSNEFITEFSGLKPGALPSQINLLTLKQLDANNILLRLENIYQKNEDPSVVAVDLNGLFSSYKITQIQELSLAANFVVNSNTPANIMLQPMEIKTYQLTVQSI